MVERLNGIQEVAGSIPTISTIRGKYAPYMIGQSAFAIDVKHRFE